MSATVQEQLAELDAPVGDPHPVNPLAGNPGMIGFPTVIAGAIGLGLVNVGFVSPAAAGAGVPIIMSATAIGLLLAMIWAAALGHNASATLYAAFFGFYGSYAALVLGLTHNWFGIPAEEAGKATEMWLICWLATIGLLTLVTLRLPSSFTLLLGLVDVALVLLLLGTTSGETTWTRAGGIVVFAFVAVAVYLYVDMMETETGGRGLPLGKPLIGA